MERTENTSTQLEVKHSMVLGTFPISVSIVPSSRCRGTGRGSTTSTGRRFGGQRTWGHVAATAGSLFSFHCFISFLFAETIGIPDLRSLQISLSLSGLIQ